MQKLPGISGLKTRIHTGIMGIITTVYPYRGYCANVWYGYGSLTELAAVPGAGYESHTCSG